ncbi:MAG TPA: transglutaminase domain-containing protein [Burkholderiales bacterium]|jgi:transglutaminase-like putative cysteine protease|nr:transglutaminase domain-containing protein [Burkholderiales bacterium]
MSAALPLARPALPPFAIGAALVFWGWQSGNLAVGLIAALALEAPRWLNLRIDLGVTEHSTIADLSTIGFVLLAVIIAANRGVASGVLQAFIWLPLVLSPIVLAQYVCAERRLPLSALFRYMRKLKRQNPETLDPLVDIGAVYVALVLLSAGVANQRGPGYYIGIVLGAALLLYGARPREANLAAGAAMVLAAAGFGYVGHVALADAQSLLIDWVMDLDLIRRADPDPYRVRTEIGSLGRLKKYDAIVLRVYASESDVARVRLLHRASYNTYLGRTWIARGPGMASVNSESDNETWILSREAPDWSVRIATSFELGRALLPLPAGTVRIESFPANAMSRNSFGAVHAVLGVDWASYVAKVADGTPLYSAPAAEDLAVPLEEAAVFDRIAGELGLRNIPVPEALKRVNRFFAGFRYSTWRDRPVPQGETALGDFMTRTKAGHCEYFAAATTLLLRAAGIPARYATGFAVIEYSDLESAFIVRTRHAHAWAQAFVDGRWTDFDTTPADWAPEEAREAPVWQGLMDLLRYAGFRWSQRGEFRAGNAWFLVLAVLAGILAWRVLRGRKIVREEKLAAAARLRFPGQDSEFYALEKSFGQRDSTETQAAWFFRIEKTLAKDRRDNLLAALRLHQRYRFDPDGITLEERKRLRELCATLAPQKA